jgi:hypothetical protein
MPVHAGIGRIGNNKVHRFVGQTLQKADAVCLLNQKTLAFNQRLQEVLPLDCPSLVWQNFLPKAGFPRKPLGPDEFTHFHSLLPCYSKGFNG